MKEHQAKIACAFTAGELHLQWGIGCQDWADGFVDPQTGRSALAVADGGGSRRRAAESACCAVQTVLRYFRTHPVTDADADALWNELCAAQDALGFAREELGTTLLFFAVENGRFCAGHIGDGAILRGDAEGFTVLSAPENGEQKNITFFLPTSDRSRFRLQRGELQQMTCVLLATDGASDRLYDDITGRGMPACRKLEDCCRSLPRADAEQWILDALREVFAEYSDDDKTIALLTF